MANPYTGASVITFYKNGKHIVQMQAFVLIYFKPANMQE
jgi:hypothetical protein